MAMSERELWEARRDAARAILAQARDEAERTAVSEKINTVYMEGCQPPAGTHPAIMMAEGAAYAIRVWQAQFYARNALYLAGELEKIDALTYLEES